MKHRHLHLLLGLTLVAIMSGCANDPNHANIEQVLPGASVKKIDGGYFVMKHNFQKGILYLTLDENSSYTPSIRRGEEILQGNTHWRSGDLTTTATNGGLIHYGTTVISIPKEALGTVSTYAYHKNKPQWQATINYHEDLGTFDAAQTSSTVTEIVIKLVDRLS